MFIDYRLKEGLKSSSIYLPSDWITFTDQGPAEDLGRFGGLVWFCCCVTHKIHLEKKFRFVCYGQLTPCLYHHIGSNKTPLAYQVLAYQELDLMQQIRLSGMPVGIGIEPLLQGAISQHVLAYDPASQSKV